jgi:hypothetical protein
MLQGLFQVRLGAHLGQNQSPLGIFLTTGFKVSSYANPHYTDYTIKYQGRLP